MTDQDSQTLPISQQVLLAERDWEIANLKNRTLVLGQLLDQALRDLAAKTKELNDLREHVAEKLTGVVEDGAPTFDGGVPT